MEGRRIAMATLGHSVIPVSKAVYKDPMLPGKSYWVDPRPHEQFPRFLKKQKLNGSTQSIIHAMQHALASHMLIKGVPTDKLVLESFQLMLDDHTELRRMNKWSIGFWFTSETEESFTVEFLVLPKLQFDFKMVQIAARATSDWRVIKSGDPEVIPRTWISKEPRYAVQERCLEIPPFLKTTLVDPEISKDVKLANHYKHQTTGRRLLPSGYITLLLEALPGAMVEAYQLKELRVVFKRELVIRGPDTTVTSMSKEMLYHGEQEERYYKHVVHDGKSDICRALSVWDPI